MDSFNILKTVADLDAVVAASQNGPVIVYKHSLTCPISARAQEQVVRLADLPRYTLAVQYAKDVSGAVAKRFGVPHASPQLLVIEGGKVTLELTHDDIREEAVRAAL